MPRADLDLAHLSQHLLRPGDLVVSRSGTCGIAGVFGGHSLHVLPGAFLIRFRFDSVIRSDFVRDFVNSPFGVRSMLRIAEGGVQKNLRGTEVCRVMLPVPRRLEQAAVCSLLQTAVLNQETCRGNVRALQKLKSGLTRVLLSPPLPLEGN
jgi:type I restriction enzyme S subunit